MTKLNLKGLEGVLRQLKQLDAVVAQKALVSSARKAFKPVAEVARALAPMDTGALKAGIVVRAGKPKKGDAVAVVGITVVSNSTALKQAKVAAAMMNEAQSKKLPPSARWHFIELGTATQAARPFLRPALDSKAQDVVTDLGKILNQKIAAAVRKGKGK